MDKLEPKNRERRSFLKNGIQLALAGTLVGVTGLSVLNSKAKGMVWQITRSNASSVAGAQLNA